MVPSELRLRTPIVHGAKTLPGVVRDLPWRVCSVIFGKLPFSPSGQRSCSFSPIPGVRLGDGAGSCHFMGAWRRLLRVRPPRSRPNRSSCCQLAGHDKPASGFSRGVDKFAAAQPERRRQEPSHSKLLHVRVMRSLSLRNLIREGSWISCPATPDALSSEAFSGLAPETDPCRHLHHWSAFWLRVQSPVRPNPYAPGTWLRTEASNERV